MLRLIFAALRYRVAATTALGALAMLAVASAVAIPLYAAAADRHIVSSTLAAAGPADRSLTVTADIGFTEGIDPALAKLSGDVRKHAPQPLLQEVTGAFVRGIAYPDGGATGIGAPLVARDDACAHLRLASGQCPSQRFDIVISDATARKLGLQGAGATIRFDYSGVPGPARLRVTGVYTPDSDPDADPYWAGRSELTPQPLRAANPMFTTPGTLNSLGLERIQATVDLLLPPDPGTDLEQLRIDPSVGMLDAGFEVSNGLPKLYKAIADAREALGLSAPLGAATMLLLCLGTLLIAASQLARRRRAEAAVGMLHGAPWWHRFLLTRGPTLLVVLLAAPVGLALGWGAATLVTSVLFGQQAPDPFAPTPTPLIAGAAALVVSLVAVVFAEGGAHSGPVAEALRRVPSRLTRSGLLLELAFAVLAVAAVAQAVSGGLTGVGAAAPVLAAGAIGLLATRLVRPAAALAGRVALERGRVVSGLAAIQLARRSAAGGVVSLAVVSLALVANAAQAWELSERDAHSRAAQALGAQRVVTVAAVSRPALLAAVRSVDPDAAWAMAVAKELSPPEGTLVAVDTRAWPSVMDTPLPPGLRPPAANPLTVTGSELVLDVNLVQALAPMTVTAMLVAPDGAPVSALLTIPATLGRQQIRATIGPGDAPCAAGPGCRLAWFSFPRSPDELQIYAIRQAGAPGGQDSDVVSGRALTAASRWRTSFELQTEVRILPAAGRELIPDVIADRVRPDPNPPSDDYLSLRYRPADPRRISRDIRLQVADAPVPLPLAYSGDPNRKQTDALMSSGVFTAQRRPVLVVWSAQALPGIASPGMLTEFDYADRLSDSLDNAARLEVWLGRSAPADAVARLTSAGLVAMRTDTITDRAARDRLGGNGLGLRLQVAAAGLGMVVAILAMLVLSAADRRSRAADMRALLDQGVPRRLIKKVAHAGYRMIILACLPVAALACLLLWWLGSTTGAWALSPVRVLLPVAAGALVLLAVGWAADKGTDRTAGDGS